MERFMPERRFVPATLATTSFAAIEPLFFALESRVIESAPELERWLLDCSELGAVVSEVGAVRYIEMTCHTDDKAIEAAYLEWIEKVVPQCRPHWQRLDEKYLACEFRSALAQQRYRVFERNTANDVAIFREANIPLQTEEARLDQQQAKIAGAMTVYFDGALRTMPQMARFLEEPDRRLRQFAWEAVVTRRLANEKEFDELLDKQITLRDHMARNADLPSFVELAFCFYRRFDYTPADCFAFHDAIEKTCVPVLRRLQERRRERLKVERLRPWDLNVDPQNRPPLRPFATAEELAEKSERILARLDEELAGEFRGMRERKLLDLDSRPGKAPGGYQSTLDERRVPFIFMNAAGLHDDLQTLLHEAGHAFHANAARHDPLLAYRSSPIEFCEVASMGMELLAGPALAEVYAPAEHARAVRKHLEGIIGLLPWVAQIDAFQHWMYSHPKHTHAERNEFWMSLNRRFGGIADWSGYEHPHAVSWQRQRHLWNCPFYYVEYGIAQLGALQLWANSLTDAGRALAAYKRALALGGSRPLPELFEAAEIRFDFSIDTLRPLMELIQQQLSGLPD
jgi:oligoendopeptidase F